MADSSSSSSSKNSKPKSPITFLILFLLPVSLAVVFYWLDSFDPAPFPFHEFSTQSSSSSMVVPKVNHHLLNGSEKIGDGELFGPEDIAFHYNSGVIYTGCDDGWIKRVKLNESAVVDSVVENWINTGGRPLGLVLGHHGDVIIADAVKGLLNATSDNTIQLLTDEVEGVKIKFADAVDIAKDGILYFSDASSKYSYHEHAFDLLEGRPYGRLLSYNPSTKVTKVVLNNLYFANGVAVSPDNDFVVVCETPMRRCKRYYLSGEKKGSADIFVENLPGLPDNILYDGEGLFWIALFTEHTTAWKIAQRYPIIRKLLAIVDKYTGRPSMERNGGVVAVDLNGKPVAYYHDQNALITSAIKIGDHLYIGSIVTSYILRIDLNQNPAVSIKPTH